MIWFFYLSRWGDLSISLCLSYVYVYLLRHSFPQEERRNRLGRNYRLFVSRLSYSSSVTGSSHSLKALSPGTSKARWANQQSAAAPCQCLTFAGIWITVPGRIYTAGFPSSWYQPRPATPISICPPPLLARWMCQLLRQRGSNVTLDIFTCSREMGAR